MIILIIINDIPYNELLLLVSEVSLLKTQRFMVYIQQDEQEQNITYDSSRRYLTSYSLQNDYFANTTDNIFECLKRKSPFNFFFQSFETVYKRLEEEIPKELREKSCSEVVLKRTFDNAQESIKNLLKHVASTMVLLQGEEENDDDHAQLLQTILHENDDDLMMSNDTVMHVMEKIFPTLKQYMLNTGIIKHT